MDKFRNRCPLFLGMNSRVPDKGQWLDRISKGKELLRVEIFRVRIGGISSQGLRDWLPPPFFPFTPFPLHCAHGLRVGSPSWLLLRHYLCGAAGDEGGGWRGGAASVDSSCRTASAVVFQESSRLR